MIDLKSKTICDHIVSTERFTLQACPRCMGQGFYYDISFDAHGKLNTVTSQQKLSQEILKILSEERRYTGYGIRLASLVGQLGTEFQSAIIRGDVTSALQYLQYLQQQELGKGKNILPSEEISQIVNVEALQNDLDPRLWHIAASVITKSGNTDNVSTTVSSGQATGFTRGLDTIGINGSINLT